MPEEEKTDVMAMPLPLKRLSQKNVRRAKRSSNKKDRSESSGLFYTVSSSLIS